MATNRRLIPHPDVVHTALPGGESVLLNLSTGDYYTLNETGNCIWQWLVDGDTAETIGQKLAARYAVTPERARQSVAALLAELQQETLLQTA